MLAEINKASCRDFMERAFNRGDVSAIDELTAVDGIDHQEPPGTDYHQHLREVVTAMRAAFPDLHFEIHDMIAEGEIVAFRSTMTGTQLGPLNLGPLHLPPTGRKVSVAHLHYLRLVNGVSTDLWHQWDMPGMMRQLGLAQGQRQPA